MWYSKQVNNQSTQYYKVCPLSAGQVKQKNKKTKEQFTRGKYNGLRYKGSPSLNTYPFALDTKICLTTFTTI